jgi:hypothetical protein
MSGVATLERAGPADLTRRTDARHHQSTVDPASMEPPTGERRVRSASIASDRVDRSL